MNDQTNKNSQPQQINVIVKSDVSNAIGIASFVFGIISIFFLAPLFVSLAVLLGIIAIVKKQLVWGILGLISAIIGFITSPILMGFFGLMTAAINIPNIQTPSTTGTGNVGFGEKAIQCHYTLSDTEEHTVKGCKIEPGAWRLEVLGSNEYYRMKPANPKPDEIGENVGKIRGDTHSSISEEIVRNLPFKNGNFYGAVLIKNPDRAFVPDGHIVVILNPQEPTIRLNVERKHLLVGTREVLLSFRTDR